ncbi:MAG: hypothetical protein AAB482_01560 [Patescibacteria group bacterium]
MLKAWKVVLFLGIFSVGLVGCSGGEPNIDPTLRAPSVDESEMSENGKAVFTVTQEPKPIFGTTLVRVIVKRTESRNGKALFSAIVGGDMALQVGQRVRIVSVRNQNSLQGEAHFFTIALPQ